jgi:hypothetical protein
MALLTATERVPPLLVLFPAGGAGLQLGPPLAVRLGGAFAVAADIEVADSPIPLADSVGRVQLRRWRRDRSAYRRLDPVEMERPVIAILGAHGPARDAGTERVEIDVIECPAQTPARVVELESVPDEDAAVPLARALVVVDPAIGAEAVARIRAAAPPGVTVADLGRVSEGAVAAATPELLVCVGSADVPATPSPRTKVAVVLPGGSNGAAAGAPHPGADVVWHAAGAAAWDELAQALPRLVAALGAERERGR